jgi:hypothetical protein
MVSSFSILLLRQMNIYQIPSGFLKLRLLQDVGEGGVYKEIWQADL